MIQGHDSTQAVRDIRWTTRSVFRNLYVECRHVEQAANRTSLILRHYCEVRLSHSVPVFRLPTMECFTVSLWCWPYGWVLPLYDVLPPALAVNKKTWLSVRYRSSICRWMRNSDFVYNLDAVMTRPNRCGCIFGPTSLWSNGLAKLHSLIILRIHKADLHPVQSLGQLS